MEERIVELEARMAYQDKTINDLDEVVRLFADRVERLERRIAELGEALLDTQTEIGPADERPPHY